MTYQQRGSPERWGAALGFLSMDVMRPFYTEMGVPIPGGGELISAIREAIIQNREEFLSRPEVIPDLRSRWLRLVRARFGEDYPAAFEAWVEETFVYLPIDFAPLSGWWFLFALSRTDDQRWKALGLPVRVDEKTRSRFSQDLDWSKLNATADEIDRAPLSEWDLAMYTIHGFDDTDDEPYNYALATIKRRRFVEFLRWLTGELSKDELSALTRRANEAAARIETFAESPPLAHPLDALRANARH